MTSPIYQNIFLKKEEDEFESIIESGSSPKPTQKALAGGSASNRDSSKKTQSSIASKVMKDNYFTESESSK